MLKGRRGGDGIYYVNIADPKFSASENQGIAYEVSVPAQLWVACAMTNITTIPIRQRWASWRFPYTLSADAYLMFWTRP